LGIILLALTISITNAQVKSFGADTSLNKISLQDSLALDTAIAEVADTLTPAILKARDSVSAAKWLDTLHKGYGFEVFSLEMWTRTAINPSEKITYQHGDLLPKGNVWVLSIIGFLLVLFAVLKNTFTKQLSAITQSFYSNRALVNLNREDDLITSWSFLLLFIQFGFTIGMFFYLVAQFKELPKANEGF